MVFGSPGRVSAAAVALFCFQLHTDYSTALHRRLARLIATSNILSYWRTVRLESQLACCNLRLRSLALHIPTVTFYQSFTLSLRAQKIAPQIFSITHE